eukprot:967361-Rhodomonas_salina.1
MRCRDAMPSTDGVHESTATFPLSCYAGAMRRPMLTHTALLPDAAEGGAQREGDDVSRGAHPTIRYASTGHS